MDREFRKKPGEQRRSVRRGWDEGRSRRGRRRRRVTREETRLEMSREKEEKEETRGERNTSGKFGNKTS